ncbi:hypothetical protein EDD76_104117 [Kineothrix alysoides]|uniref:Uncharacterized protein n=1 Tax=Kineothrix alysoides TaxID=1469948 RepID=A0A4R1R1Z5_9FIRM|nr:hypothetical protein [Kineothrix alysoides]TCL59380.1 hypothetical protein EDD76_104117 [Kineothrix alysoides]
MTKSKLKELSYYLFFGLMIFAKGIGLDSGDKIYYLLSAAACVCVVLKLILTKYNKKQIAAMILLCLIAFAAYRNSGRLGILLTTLTVVGIKDIDIRKLFKIGAVVYTVSFIGTVLAAGIGIIPNPLVVHDKGNIGEIIRWGMGYSTGNVFHESYFILVALVGYALKDKFNFKKAMGFMLGNILVFLFSVSYTGIIVTTFYLALNLYAVNKSELSRGEKLLSQLFFPACLLISFGGPQLLNYPFMQKLDSMMQARLSFSQYYLWNQPITLFGTRMKDLPNFWTIMDNGYVYFFMTFGVIAFLLFCIGYIILIAGFSGILNKIGKRKHLRKCEKDLPALAMILSFLLYGIMEQFISNSFMNVSLLFMGIILYGKEADEKTGNRCNKYLSRIRKVVIGKKYFYGTGAVGGTIFLCCYLLRTTMPDYVEVPVRALGYVDAQSVIIHAVDTGASEGDLEEEMEQYVQAVCNEGAIRDILRETGLNGRLTEAQVNAALEFSFPQSVRSNKRYDAFRVRLFELYSDISEEEYRVLLTRIISGNAMADEIYPERIMKDSGSDRIEHISQDKNYMVEKTGNIVRIEYVRGALLNIFEGYLLGSILFVMIGMVRYNDKQKGEQKQKNENSD